MAYVPGYYGSHSRQTFPSVLLLPLLPGGHNYPQLPWKGSQGTVG